MSEQRTATVTEAQISQGQATRDRIAFQLGTAIMDGLAATVRAEAAEQGLAGAAEKLAQLETAVNGLQSDMAARAEAFGEAQTEWAGTEAELRRTVAEQRQKLQTRARGR